MLSGDVGHDVRIHAAGERIECPAVVRQDRIQHQCLTADQLCDVIKACPVLRRKALEKIIGHPARIESELDIRILADALQHIPQCSGAAARIDA